MELKARINYEKGHSLFTIQEKEQEQEQVSE
jgi:hypothetical protein